MPVASLLQPRTHINPPGVQTPPVAPAPEQAAANAAAAPHIGMQIQNASVSSRLCAALRTVRTAASRKSSAAPSKSAAAPELRAFAGPSQQGVPLPPQRVKVVEDLPPSYDASSADARWDGGAAPAARVPDAPVPPYPLKEAAAPGMMLFRADLPTGSPPLSPSQLRPGMPLHVWDGKRWDTATVGQMRVAVGGDIQVFDQSNSHLLPQAA